MRALSTTELLRVWEAGEGRSNVERGLAILRVAHPELDANASLDMSIGDRDACLLALREATFGRRIASTAACPACAERLELELDAATLRLPPLSSTDASGDLTAGVRSHCAKSGEFEVRFRLPTSRDLWSARAKGDFASARLALLERCIVQAHYRGEACNLDALPDEVVDCVAEEMSHADPRGDVCVRLSCPTCLHVWDDRFDVVAFLWTEIQVGAVRLLREVHTLASAYGWSEDSILALTPARRQHYLQLVAS